MNELTGEQVEFLAKFMGWDGLHAHQGDWRINFTRLDVREAVMDRAVEKYGQIMVDDYGDKPDSARRYRILLNTDKEQYDIQQGTDGMGPTRFIALVNALMEAEKP